MLAQTVRSNLKDINNLKMRTKTTKFGSLFQTVPVVENDLRQVLAKEGLIEIAEDEQWEELVVEDEEPVEETFDIVEEDDELYEIVEDTTQVLVKFPIVSSIKLEEKLPFFKSISLKLASL